MNESIEDQESEETGGKSDEAATDGTNPGEGGALQTPELILILFLIGVTAGGFWILYWPLIDMMRRYVAAGR